MPNTRDLKRSFAAGEISPEMYGRIDDAKFQSGAKTMRNMIATPQGPAKNRAGFAFVKATKNNAVARLIPFTYSTTQTMVIEMGQRYMRFHTQGATLQYSATQPAYVPTQVVTFTAFSASINWPSHGLTNGNPVQFSVIAGTMPSGIAEDTTYLAVVVDANTITITPVGGGGSVIPTTSGTSVHGGYFYAQGTLVSQGGAVYYREVGGVDGLNSIPLVFNWYQLPSDLTYEIPTPYLQADLFAIHYVQSQDVMTLVHPNYPPMELRRLSATEWVLTAINFGTTVATPTNVTIAASPGYKAIVSTIDTANPALITTAANHTLALGDGIYWDDFVVVIGGLNTDLSGFYLVNNVPTDPSTGDLIPNELTVMDYSGNTLDGSSWTSVISYGNIQLGTKIFDINNEYAVAALGADGVTESQISSTVSVINNLDVPGSYNTISWNDIDDALRYYVYKKLNGLFGFIGETPDGSFVDNNIAPDFSITPPNFDSSLFLTDANYPAAVGYFQQRRWFGGTTKQPQNMWGSNTGTEGEFAYSLPSLATDRIAFQVAALEASLILHIIPLQQLLLLTSSCEFAVMSTGVDVLTPSSIDVKPQSYVGASTVKPTITNNSLVYCAARGGHVREMGYQWQANGFVTGDLSLRANHLFDNMSLLDQTFAKAPLPIIWFVSSNGKLLGLTYIPEEQIGAWHQHDTDGIFESVACVAEGDEDRLYAVINRTVNGQTVRYVERMASRLIDPAHIEDCFFVDSGATYDGAPVTTISNLTWLEGKTVSVLADGCVQNQKTVSGGSIELDRAASVVQVGLPITADIETLPLVLQIDGYGQGRTKNINKCWVRVYQSSSLLVGPSEDKLIEVKQRTTEPYGAPPSLVSTELEVTTFPWWQKEGHILIRQVNPLPLEVTAITMEVSIGG